MCRCMKCFNTQPPEGGCAIKQKAAQRLTLRFNTQPPEGGCFKQKALELDGNVSTHSRPKAAAFVKTLKTGNGLQFQHTAARRRLLGFFANFRRTLRFQHTAARRRLLMGKLFAIKQGFVSTHSRPKAAADHNTKVKNFISPVSTHSRPKAAALASVCGKALNEWFQHTAARRRLPWKERIKGGLATVSTHSRPKAAADEIKSSKGNHFVSTHSRPKAAAATPFIKFKKITLFQHTAARRRLLPT